MTTTPVTTDPYRATGRSIRRAGSQDLEALLPIAMQFVADDPLGGKLPAHEESVRSALLRCLVGGACSGAVFLAEAAMPASGRPHETATTIVGAIMGEMRQAWHSREPFAEHLGGFADGSVTGEPSVAEPLREAFRRWARDTQRARWAIIDGVVVGL